MRRVERAPNSGAKRKKRKEISLFLYKSQETLRVFPLQYRKYVCGDRGWSCYCAPYQTYYRKNLCLNEEKKGKYYIEDVMWYFFSLFFLRFGFQPTTIIFLLKGLIYKQAFRTRGRTVSFGPPIDGCWAQFFFSSFWYSCRSISLSFAFRANHFPPLPLVVVYIQQIVRHPIAQPSFHPDLLPC